MFKRLVDPSLFQKQNPLTLMVINPFQIVLISLESVTNHILVELPFLSIAISATPLLRNKNIGAVDALFVSVVFKSIKTSICSGIYSCE